MKLSKAQELAEKAIYDYTSSSKWQQVKNMTWTTSEVQDVIAKAIVKNIEVIPCCKSDSELLSCCHCKGTGKVHYDNGTWQLCYTCGGSGTR